MGFYGCIPRFIKNHATWILTALGLGGFVGTTVLVANEAPKVAAKIDEASQEKDLTIRDKAEIIIPGYLPAILLGLVTGGCFVGAQILNVRQQALLLGAYGLVMKEYDTYRGEVREAIGKDKEKELYISARRKVRALEVEIEKLKEKNGPYFYAISTLPGWIFEMNPKDVSMALMYFNRNLTIKGEADLAELYSFLGIPEHAYNQDDSSEYGWNVCANEVEYGYFYNDFRIREIVTESGKVLRLIDSDIQPYRLGMDYGGDDHTSDYLYPGYDPEGAIDRALEKDVLKTNPPDISAPGLFEK